MALGGGEFKTMDKSMPGAYINTVSASTGLSITGDRGVVAIAIEHDYGNNGEIMEITPSDFREDSLTLLGYNLYHDKLKGLRELFANSQKVLLYILNKTDKASNDYATAKKGGIRGNDITIKVQNNIDNLGSKDVITMLDYIVIDKQTVKTAKDLRDNALVEFKPNSELAITAGEKLKGGGNGIATNAEHQDFLNKLETRHFNALACMATTKILQNLYIAYTKRMRNEVGLKFATILCEASDLAGDTALYDFEGFVVTVNKVKDKEVKGTELVPFTAAIYANAGLGKANLNKAYSGEYEIIADYTQPQLKELAKQGRFVYHRVGDTFRVFEDINGLITTSETKGEEFKDNQVIRICDDLAMADAKVFNEIYLGDVNATKSGMESLENRLISIRDTFVSENALKSYDKESLKVEKIESVGGKKLRGAVKVSCGITPAECFRQLYMTTRIH